MSRQVIPVISLFSGCGGMDLGFRRQGFLPVLAIDIDPSAVETYNRNDRRHIARVGDLAALSDNEILALVGEVAPGVHPRGVIGGPPCQSFSISNVHHKKKDPRRQLPLRYAEILKALNKEFNLDFFVFENVVGLKSRKHKRHFRKILGAFDEAGFNIFEQELDALAFGVPQQRRRVFVVGINKRLYPNVQFEFPTGDADHVVTVRDAIGGLPKPAYFKRDIRRNEIPYHPNHWTMNPRSPKFTNGSSENGRSFRRLRWNEPSWTVAYGNREMHIHPNGRRRVSVYEAMVFQGFPKSYELRGSLTEQVTQVSDAVPPPLASALAAKIHETIYKRVQNIQKHLLGWFEKNQRSFPWRETQDPYEILIAEKLLQQTAARDIVVQVYQELLRRYPTIYDLAEAPLPALEKLLHPLGLSRRANELGAMAKELVNYRAGQVPQSLEELLELPGVGDYSARAILSFAFGADIPVVDTNVARFLFRLHGIEEPMPSNPSRKKSLIELAGTLVAKGQSKEYNLAILDLCAQICKPTKPLCSDCPVQESCSYGTKGVISCLGTGDQQFNQ